MLQGRAANGDLVEASPGASARCPGCCAPLQARCGAVNAWHWAHEAGDCDPWHEPETEWHLGWKRRVRPEFREVVMGPHRADIRTPNGLVVELQHSSISVPEIDEREEFYGAMIWLFDAQPFLTNIAFSTISSVAPPEVLFHWRYPRRTMRSIGVPLFWDLGDERIVEVLEVPGSRAGRRYGLGRLIHVNEFLATYLAEAVVSPNAAPRRLLSAQRTIEALRTAASHGHAFSSSDPQAAHECEQCHLRLDLWIGEPNPALVARSCKPRDPNEEHDVPF